MNEKRSIEDSEDLSLADVLEDLFGGAKISGDSPSENQPTLLQHLAIQKLGLIEGVLGSHGLLASAVERDETKDGYGNKEVRGMNELRLTWGGFLWDDEDQGGPGIHCSLRFGDDSMNVDFFYGGWSTELFLSSDDHSEAMATAQELRGSDPLKALTEEEALKLIGRMASWFLARK